MSLPSGYSDDFEDLRKTIKKTVTKNWESVRQSFPGQSLHGALKKIKNMSAFELGALCTKTKIL